MKEFFFLTDYVQYTDKSAETNLLLTALYHKLASLKDASKIYIFCISFLFCYYLTRIYS